MPGVIENVVQFVVLTLSVPVLILILGLVIGWAILGFRKPMVPSS